MVVYIASTILRGDYVGPQYMETTHYDSVFGVIKEVSNGLWDALLCKLQGTCVCVVESTTRLFMEILEISILGVASVRHSKGFKMLHNFPLTKEISVSSFFHCYIGGVTKCA